MTDTRPLWLLDVDGVLNVNPGKPRWHAAPRKTVARPGDGKEYVLRWAPALIARVRSLHTSGTVEVRWASSWIGHTDVLARTLGLPDFEDAYVMHGAYSHQHRKLDAAIFAARRGRRVIWTDDDAIPSDGEWRRFLDDAGALLIAPRPNRGLSPEHMDAIEAYAHRYTSGPSVAGSVGARRQAVVDYDHHPGGMIP